MTIIDRIFQSKKYGNTGQPTGGFPTLDHFTGILLHFDGFEVSDANLASYTLFQATLQNATLAAAESRIFPIMQIQGMTDNTPAVETKTASYGNKVSQVEKPHSFTFELENWGIGWFSEVRRFNERLDARAYFVTPKSVLGEKTDTGFQGFEVLINFEQVKVGNVADYTKYNVNVEITNPTALSEDLHAVEIPEGTSLRNKLKGITSVSIEVFTNTLGKVSVDAIKNNNRISLYQSYALNMLQEEAWKVTDMTGMPIAFQVTADDVNQKVVINHTYGGNILVSLQSPSVLASLMYPLGSVSQGGFESDTVQILAIGYIDGGNASTTPTEYINGGNASTTPTEYINGGNA